MNVEEENAGGGSGRHEGMSSNGPVPSHIPIPTIGLSARSIVLRDRAMVFAANRKFSISQSNIMKLNSPSLFAAATAVIAVLALQGCSTTSSQPTELGTSSNIVFPKADRAWPKGGTSPNLENLRLLRPGMTKDQLYALVGKPHFNEGILGVREWDYLFSFQTGRPAPNDTVQCQMKVLFDKDALARSYYWSPETCVGFVKTPQPSALAQAAPTSAGQGRTVVGTDELFTFNGSRPEDIVPEGRQRIDALGRDLAAKQTWRRVEVTAYTDRLGLPEHNQWLSQQRADTVKGLLVAQGLDSNAISARGLGATSPVSHCGALPREELVPCLAPDRRVEIRVENEQ